MLPLISNVLPQATASQASVAATSASFVAAQAAAASRPLTPVAVTAAGAANALPQLPTRRNEGGAARTVANSSLPQSDRPAILPDPEFWKVPNRPAGEQIAPLPSRQQLIDSVQQAVQYTTQAAAQEAPEVLQERAQATQNLRRFNALLAKKPGVSNSSGLGAYNVAAQRSMQMSLPANVETVI